jgi:DNA anti-recombination protein RmuC
LLGAIKTEFGKFGGMLEKAQKNLHTATDQLDELVGKRTKAIQRRLRDVETLPQGEAAIYLPEMPGEDNGDEEEKAEKPDHIKSFNAFDMDIISRFYGSESNVGEFSHPSSLER